MTKLLNTLNKEIRIILWSIKTLCAVVKAGFQQLYKGNLAFFWFAMTVCVRNNYAGARYQWLKYINPTTCNL